MKFAPIQGDVENNQTRAERFLQTKLDGLEIDLLVLPALAFSGKFDYQDLVIPLASVTMIILSIILWRTAKELLKLCFIEGFSSLGGLICLFYSNSHANSL